MEYDIKNLFSDLESSIISLQTWNVKYSKNTIIKNGPRSLVLIHSAKKHVIVCNWWKPPLFLKGQFYKLYKLDKVVYYYLVSVLVDFLLLFAHSRGLANTANFIVDKMRNIYKRMGFKGRHCIHSCGP